MSRMVRYQVFGSNYEYLAKSGDEYFVIDAYQMLMAPDSVQTVFPGLQAVRSKLREIADDMGLRGLVSERLVDAPEMDDLGPSPKTYLADGFKVVTAADIRLENEQRKFADRFTYKG